MMLRVLMHSHGGPWEQYEGVDRLSVVYFARQCLRSSSEGLLWRAAQGLHVARREIDCAPMLHANCPQVLLRMISLEWIADDAAFAEGFVGHQQGGGVFQADTYGA